MATPNFTATGTKATTAVTLNKDIFGVVPESQELLKQAYMAYLANGRQNLAVAKTRGEVRGGGKKPWRQKGTGRARFGSSRVPIWRGGGITFGPTGEESYTRKLQVGAKRTAIRQALSIAAKEDRIRVIETFSCKDGKVSETVRLMQKINATGTILLVVSLKDELVERATRNVSGLKVVSAQYLNVYDLLNADTVVISKASLTVIDAWLGKDKES